MKKTICIILSLLMLCFIFTSCSKAVESDYSSETQESVIEAEVISPKLDVTEEVDTVDEPVLEETEPSSEPEEGHDNSMLPPADTDNEAFNEKFSQNVLDLAYEEEILAAYSTADWIKICDKYVNLWKDETNNAYKELLASVSQDRYPALRSEQEQWLDELNGQIEEIRESALNEGGSLSMFTACSDIMMIYRNRAMELYSELYELDPDFNFAFTANG